MKAYSLFKQPKDRFSLVCIRCVSLVIPNIVLWIYEYMSDLPYKQEAFCVKVGSNWYFFLILLSALNVIGICWIRSLLYIPFLDPVIFAYDHLQWAGLPIWWNLWEIQGEFCVIFFFPCLGRDGHRDVNSFFPPEGFCWVLHKTSPGECILFFIYLAIYKVLLCLFGFQPHSSGETLVLSFSL